MNNQSVADYIRSLGINFTQIYVGETTRYDRPVHEWRAIFTRHGKRPIEVTHVIALARSELDMVAVLHDVVMLTNMRFDGFRNYCVEYGHDWDSITMKRDYKYAKKVSKQARNFFSLAEMDKLQEIL